MDLIDIIRGGITAYDFFDYNGHLIKIRPLTSMEVDDAKSHGYEYVDSNIARLMVNINLGFITGADKLAEIPKEMYPNMDKFNREINYWIVYHGMKDFMPEDFSIDDVRKMQHVHKIAKRILGISAAPKNRIVEILKTEDGVELARLIWHYNVNLVKDIKELTPIQHQFLIYSDPNRPVEVTAVDDALPEFGKLINNVRKGNKSN